MNIFQTLSNVYNGIGKSICEYKIGKLEAEKADLVNKINANTNTYLEAKHQMDTSIAKIKKSVETKIDLSKLDQTELKADLDILDKENLDIKIFNLLKLVIEIGQEPNPSEDKLILMIKTIHNLENYITNQADLILNAENHYLQNKVNKIDMKLFKLNAKLLTIY
jgi:hypothetical protein